jgi:hypothetical protein
VRLQFPDTSGTDLIDDIAEMMVRGCTDSGEPRGALLGAVLKRINDIESPYTSAS